MFKIGEFSKITQIAVSQLRYYDEINLFKPVYSDPDTGYRYYSTDQLPELNRIMVLRGLGLSLDQIKAAAQDNISNDEIKGMLRLKKAQLEQEITHEQIRLKLVESRLQQLEQAGQMPVHDVVVKEIPAQTFLALRETVRGGGVMQTILDIFQVIQEAEVKPEGPCMALFHDWSFYARHFDWEIGFPVRDFKTPKLQTPDSRFMQARELPPVELMATFVHRGSWAALHKGYSTLGRWMEVNGYRIGGIARELFFRMERRENMHQNITEIQFPIVKIS